MNARDLFDLKGKTALITGGSRGLGLQMAEALGDMGARVIVTARKQTELDEAAAHLSARNIDAFTCVNDLSKFDTIVPLVDQIVAARGPIDILINNAGTTWGAPAEDYPDDAWRKVMDLNVNGLFFLTREIGKRCMVPRRSGKIINIASIGGLMGNPPEMMTIAYNTSKGAVINFTRTLAAEWGKYSINVNAICPGFFPSKMSSGLLETIGAGVIARTPLQRLGGEDDLKGAAIFLSSDASRHITGQYITVDGGATIA